MKFAEKAEEVCAHVKNTIANRASNPVLPVAEEVRKKLEYAGRSQPFFQHLPAISETVCGKSSGEFALFDRGFASAPAFFRFSPQV